MVVPVPVVLQEQNVKTLPRDIFDRPDKLSAPRLVEYWEQDPCKPPPLPRVLLRGADLIKRRPLWDMPPLSIRHPTYFSAVIARNSIPLPPLHTLEG
jgi:hypothetical protein